MLEGSYLEQIWITNNAMRILGTDFLIFAFSFIWGKKPNCFGKMAENAQKIKKNLLPTFFSYNFLHTLTNCLCFHHELVKSYFKKRQFSE